MRIFTILLLMVGFTFSDSLAGEPPPPVRRTVPKRRRLQPTIKIPPRAKWFNTRDLVRREAPTLPKPLRSGRLVIPVYLIPRDRKPAKNWQAKYRVILAFVNAMFRDAAMHWSKDDREKHGLAFPFNKDGTIKVYGYKSRLPLSAFVRPEEEVTRTRGKHQYLLIVNGEIQKFIRKEFGKGFRGRIRLPDRRRIFLVLVETYIEGIPGRGQWNNSVAMGSSKNGVAVVSASILRDDLSTVTIAGQMSILRSKTLINPPQGGSYIRFPRLSQGHMSGTRMRTIAHELGHTFGLEHEDGLSEFFYSVMMGGRPVHSNYLPEMTTVRKVVFASGSVAKLKKRRGRGLR